MPEGTENVDYAGRGLDVQSAMLEHASAFPTVGERPDHIVWGGKELRTSYAIPAPEQGRVRIELLTAPSPPRQGVDLLAKGGGLTLQDGEQVELLRTWNGDGLEPVVEYVYRSPSRKIWFWNVYEVPWPNGRLTVEKWTGNSGFLTERQGDGGWLFHCSPGHLDQPDFGSLIVRVVVW